MNMLTRTQVEGLRRIWKKGPSVWCLGGRSGGATARMFDALVKRGLCAGPPYKITSAGETHVRAYDVIASRRSRSGEGGA